MPSMELRFIATGKPMTPDINPKIDREASRKGVMQSGVETRGDLNRLIQEEIVPSLMEIGRNATKVVSSKGAGIDVMA
ncbi:hypothetical protein ACFL7D_09890 [candidate division KSB1 bacterium]